MKKTGLGILLALMSAPLLAGVNDAQATQAIGSFYRQYVFGNKDLADNGTRVATARMLKKLKQFYEDEFDCDDGKCYAAFALRTGAQDGSGSSKIVAVSPKKGGWYRVEYRDMGYKGITDVKVVEADGRIKLDDYKKIFDGSH